MLVNFEDHFYLTDLVPNVVSLPQEERLSGRIAGMTAGIRCWTPGEGCPYWGPMSHRRAVEWSQNSKARPWESFYRPSATVPLSASQPQGGLGSSPPELKMMEEHFELKWEVFHLYGVEDHNIHLFEHISLFLFVKIKNGSSTVTIVDNSKK